MSKYNKMNKYAIKGMGHILEGMGHIIEDPIPQSWEEYNAANQDKPEIILPRSIFLSVKNGEATEIPLSEAKIKSILANNRVYKDGDLVCGYYTDENKSLEVRFTHEIIVVIYKAVQDNGTLNTTTIWKDSFGNLSGKKTIKGPKNKDPEGWILAQVDSLDNYKDVDEKALNKEKLNLVKVMKAVDQMLPATTKEDIKKFSKKK
jgi:hypothetical protein